MASELRYLAKNRPKNDNRFRKSALRREGSRFVRLRSFVALRFASGYTKSASQDGNALFGNREDGKSEEGSFRLWQKVRIVGIQRLSRETLLFLVGDSDSRMGIYARLHL